MSLEASAATRGRVNTFPFYFFLFFFYFLMRPCRAFFLEPSVIKQSLMDFLFAFLFFFFFFVLGFFFVFFRKERHLMRCEHVDPLHTVRLTFLKLWIKKINLSESRHFIETFPPDGYFLQCAAQKLHQTPQTSPFLDCSPPSVHLNVCCDNFLTYRACSDFIVIW